MNTSEVAFAEVQRVLALFTEAIAGRPLHLKPLDKKSANSYINRITTDGLSIHLPEVLADFDSERHNFGAYRIVVLHQIGYLNGGTFDFNLHTAASRMSLPEPLLKFLRQASSRDGAPEPQTVTYKYQLQLPPIRPVSALERFLSSWLRPDLMRMIFSTLEDLRIDTRMRRNYPGAAADLQRVLGHALAARPALDSLRPLAALLESLVQFSLDANRAALVAGDSSGMRAEILDAAAAVKQHGASVYDSARVAIDIYRSIEAMLRRERRRRGGESAQAGPLADEASDEAAEDRGESADEASGGDTDAEDAQAAEEDITGSGVEFRGNLMPDLVYRQTGGGQVGSSESPDTPSTENTEPTETLDAAANDSSTPGSSAALSASKKGLHDGPRSYLYDEWNYLDEKYHLAWCRLYEHRLRGEDVDFIASVRRRHAALASQVKRQFSFIKPESWQRVYRTSDGDELGLDALIETVIDRRAGQTSDEHLYVRRDRAMREVAAAFLVDMSASTDFPVPDPELEPATKPGIETTKNAAASKSAAEYGPYLYGGYDDLLPLTPSTPKRRVIDVAKESLALMCDALQTLGDSYAVYGFSGEGRENVEFHVAKDFNDRLSARTWGALAAMQPRRSTRMGPAIRHAASKLAHQPMRLRVMIIISDGYPQDSDYGPNRSDDEYGIQDTARALREAEQAGISTFCITIDPAGHDYLRRMCSANRYLVIDDVRSLPDELTKVYRALTA